MAKTIRTIVLYCDSEQTSVKSDTSFIIIPVTPRGLICVNGLAWASYIDFSAHLFPRILLVIASLKNMSTDKNEGVVSLRKTPMYDKKFFF